MSDDAFFPATSELIIATISNKRYFDLDAVREPHKGDHKDGEAIGNNKGGENGYSGFGRDVKVRVHHPAGAPPLDWWCIPDQPDVPPPLTATEDVVSGARYIIGDVFEVMKTIPDGSVDLLMTSPPFLALRSYLPQDHVQKHLEIGSEPTPAAFLDTLLALTAEWRRVLAPHGSICVELGDTFAGSGGAGGDYSEGGMRDGQPGFDGSARRNSNPDRPYRTTKDERTVDGTGIPPIRGFNGIIREGKSGIGWPMAKSLCMIPALYSASLAYGRNLLTGEPSPAGQWRVRNIVRWCRPNPPVGALGDKFRPATSEMTIACVSGSRYFDLDAVREPSTVPNAGPYRGRKASAVPGGDTRDVEAGVRGALNPAGAPPLDWWEIPTQPYAGSHYATWPMDLLVRPIKAMVPQRVCTTCGEPSRRIVEVSYTPDARPKAGKKPPEEQRLEDRALVGASSAVNASAQGFAYGRSDKHVGTLGWTDCGHGGTWRNGLVLDPFGGSGTSAAVAVGHGRDCILIDIDERNALLAEERLGMFLTVEHFNGEAVA